MTTQRDDELDLRDIDKSSAAELEIVTRMCMTTILETIPEYGGDAEVAKSKIPNFDFDQMSTMIKNDFPKDTHRFLVVVDPTAPPPHIVGHSMISLKRDSEGRPYGKFFSRYVEPAYRRRGLARRMLREALRWFESRGAVYAQAETHDTNDKLRAVFEQAGFSVVERHTSPFAYVVLRRALGEHPTANRA